MGREAQKRREAEKSPEELAQEQAAAEAGAEVQIDPAAMAMQAMMAFEDRRYLVQTVAVGKKDANGMRELTFPVSPVKQITLVLASELCDHILKEFSSGIEVADLAELAAEKEKADQAAEAAKS